MSNLGVGLFNVNRLILFMLFVFLLHSCKESTYVPNGLRKLSDEELIERSKKSYPPNLDIRVSNQRGEIIPSDSINKIPNVEQYTTDVYVNDQDEIVELVIRKANESDYRRREIINANKKKTYDENRGVYEIEVSCENLESQLRIIQKSDQDMRNSYETMNIEQDLENISKVVAILRNCNEVENLSKESKYSLWLLIQHAPPKFREEFIGKFEGWSNAGILDIKQVLMMKDRMLLDQGKPQLYGTQVFVSPETGASELYEVQDRNNLNQRRKEVGFEPIEDYLARFND